MCLEQFKVIELLEHERLTLTADLIGTDQTHVDMLSLPWPPPPQGRGALVKGNTHADLISCVFMEQIRMVA